MPLPHFVKALYTLENRVGAGAVTLSVAMKEFPAKEFAPLLPAASESTTSVVAVKRMGILIVVSVVVCDFI